MHNKIKRASTERKQVEQIDILNNKRRVVGSRGIIMSNTNISQ